MSDIVEIRSSSEGAWQRIVLNAPPGNLLSLDVVRALGKALHSLESTRRIKWLTIEGASGEFSFGARIQEHEPGMMATVRRSATTWVACSRRMTPPRACGPGLTSGRLTGRTREGNRGDD